VRVERLGDSAKKEDAAGMYTVLKEEYRKPDGPDFP
jgi:hypothetical protein